MDKYPVKGRAALNSPAGRYEAWQRQPDLAALADMDALPDQLPTQIQKEEAASIVTSNDSPDLPFDRSVNPYRGCEHGCIYCYARPSHAWLGLSPGLDFETRLFYKHNAAELLEQALQRRSYRVQPIALGTNTDIYQPIERKLVVTRRLLKVLLKYRHPTVLITKSSLILRDLELLQAMAQQNLVRVMISVTTLDTELARAMEPRACAPGKRLETLQALATAGVPTGVMVSPVIPVLTDAELETILKQASTAGARYANWVMLRLPGEVAEMFFQWLQHHYPDRAKHVENAVRDMRHGELNDKRFGERMRGSGQYAQMVSQRFDLAVRKLGLQTGMDALNCAAFESAHLHRQQLSLF